MGWTSGQHHDGALYSTCEGDSQGKKRSFCARLTELYGLNRSGRGKRKAETVRKIQSKDFKVSQSMYNFYFVFFLHSLQTLR